VNWILGAILILVFMAAQGGVVFGTAYLALRLFKTSHWLSKLFAMAISYAGWVTFTIAGYSLLGGGGGLMDGFGMVLMLCFFALISSLVYLVVWTVKGSREPVDI